MGVGDWISDKVGEFRKTRLEAELQAAEEKAAKLEDAKENVKLTPRQDLYVSTAEAFNFTDGAKEKLTHTVLEMEAAKKQALDAKIGKESDKQELFAAKIAAIESRKEVRRITKEYKSVENGEIEKRNKALRAIDTGPEDQIEKAHKKQAIYDRYKAEAEQRKAAYDEKKQKLTGRGETWGKGGDGPGKIGNGSRKSLAECSSYEQAAKVLQESKGTKFTLASESMDAQGNGTKVWDDPKYPAKQPAGSTLSEEQYQAERKAHQVTYRMENGKVAEVIAGADSKFVAAVSESVVEKAGDAAERKIGTVKVTTLPRDSVNIRPPTQSLQTTSRQSSRKEEPTYYPQQSTSFNPQSRSASRESLSSVSDSREQESTFNPLNQSLNSQSRSASMESLSSVSDPANLSESARQELAAHKSELEQLKATLQGQADAISKLTETITASQSKSTSPTDLTEFEKRIKGLEERGTSGGGGNSTSSEELGNTAGGKAPVRKFVPPPIAGGAGLLAALKSSKKSKETQEANAACDELENAKSPVEKTIDIAMVELEVMTLKAKQPQKNYDANIEEEAKLTKRIKNQEEALVKDREEGRKTPKAIAVTESSLKRDRDRLIEVLGQRENLSQLKTEAETAVAGADAKLQRLQKQLEKEKAKAKEKAVVEPLSDRRSQTDRDLTSNLMGVTPTTVLTKEQRDKARGLQQGLKEVAGTLSSANVSSSENVGSGTNVKPLASAIANTPTDKGGERNGSVER